MFDQMIADGVVSPVAWKPMREIRGTDFDVNSAYSTTTAVGLKYAKQFYTDAYKAAVESRGR